MFNKKFFIFLICLVIHPFPVFAHAFFGKEGFYDGISHPVLGLDHLLAMICVGILSAQLGGRAIWTVPSIFVIVMTIGGLFGFLLIVQEFFFVEIGIILSVILLGLAISIQKKIPIFLIMIFVGIFGLFHGIAHGLEIPAASSPILFILGFICGTTALHVFGVIVGHISNKNKVSLNFLRLTGMIFAIYGIYLFLGIFKN